MTVPAKKTPSPDIDDVARLQALVARLEEWGQANEAWARSIEIQLREVQEALLAEKGRLDALRAENEALRRGAPTGGSPRAARSSVKAAARPILDAGLRLVRTNDALRAGLRRVLHRFPTTEARLSRYAAARPPEDET